MRNIPRDAQLAFQQAVFFPLHHTGKPSLCVFPFIIYRSSRPVPWSHFHAYQTLGKSWSQITVDVSDKGVIPELKADVLSVCSGCIDFSPLHFVPAKSSGQKCNKTGSQSCSLGPGGSQVTALMCGEHLPNDRGSTREL